MRTKKKRERKEEKKRLKQKRKRENRNKEAENKENAINEKKDQFLKGIKRKSNVKAPKTSKRVNKIMKNKIKQR